MTSRRALQIVLGIALFGLGFSGFLTYGEVLAPVPAQTCAPLGPEGTLLGYPPCVYGFFMYFAIVVVSAFGLRAEDGERRSAGAGRIGGTPEPSR